MAEAGTRKCGAKHHPSGLLPPGRFDRFDATPRRFTGPGVTCDLPRYHEGDHRDTGHKIHWANR
jgi:hypothetical protein